MTLILGIETSCDETAAAVVEDGRVVRSNVIASQHDLHERYGGVVPEIASRAHLESIEPVLRAALNEAGVKLDQIDAIAVGNRPGLIGSLVVGVSAAQSLAWATGKPLIAIDHVQAHLHAPLLTENQKPETRDQKPVFPALGFVVSGGHTSLYAMQSPSEQTLLGSTIDDAVGEAYDKAAVILQLGYPGGPAVDRAARQGNPAACDLPRSLLARDSVDFSFSGLKTALLYTVRGRPSGRGKQARFERSADDLTDPQRRDLAASFQQAVVDVLITKLNRALDHMAALGQPPHALLVGGGVSANSLLRERVAELGEKRGVTVHLPAMTYCIDNAAMIAGLAFDYHQRGEHADLDLPAIATTSLISGS
ncbi:tRNA (adenosine(37)-N6)-threonylcarbamoyltransferase complex transferase subunit TsaD [Phycisphaerales bacterium AB-hyl4]|uniref:tRNA N6-adenosine threonylcarbamoyltransferase n=1 Tax=Natronomicrosphaera hydrolytica TaxID=3242702 RepID=A0ABV4U5X5_9BACT